VRPEAGDQRVDLADYRVGSHMSSKSDDCTLEGEGRIERILGCNLMCGGYEMARLLIAVDPGAGVESAELAEAWNADADAKVAGSARMEVSRTEFLPGVMELIVVPLAVNLASSAIYDLIRKLVNRLRPQRNTDSDLELTEVTIREGDRIIVVRRGVIRL
jgi:hypothetical protein